MAASGLACTVIRGAAVARNNEPIAVVGGGLGGAERAHVEGAERRVDEVAAAGTTRSTFACRSRYTSSLPGRTAPTAKQFGWHAGQEMPLVKLWLPAGALTRWAATHRTLLERKTGSSVELLAFSGDPESLNGLDVALMAPTEILAEQHFRKLIGWLEPLLLPQGWRVAWLTGSQKKKDRQQMQALIASGEAALVVGTHAVIQEQVQFQNLALAIIDEHHRFGVAQRLALREKLTRQFKRKGEDMFAYL